MIIKDDARKQVLRMWHDLPVAQRQTFAQAEAFAIAIEPSLEFRTMGDKLKVVTAWLQRDVLDMAEVRNAVKRRVVAIQQQEKAAS